MANPQPAIRPQLISRGDQVALPACYVRGGTSRAVLFHKDDLPPLETPGDYARWAPIFLAAMGSPDPAKRQLDGFGGGISSLSKVAVISPSTHPQADVDYLFGQVGVDAAVVGYRARSEEHTSEEHTSELQSLMRISYAVFCLKKKTRTK